MFLTSPNLSAFPHGFFTRKGGISKGLYASLNCGPGTKDAPAKVEENRTRVAKALGKDARLVSLYQVHGDKVMTVTKPWKTQARPQADGMISSTRKLALGILTADCAPILFGDKETGIIGAAHAGWKGVVAGVIERTVERMCAHGARLESIAAAVGPCIAQPSYEVGEDLRNSFLAQNGIYASYFTPAVRPGHFLFNLKASVRDRLIAAGLRDINLLENDTYQEEEAFFSFRRTTHRNEPDYGRQISAIMLE